MRLYTKAGDLPFETFFFPDGQPHFRLIMRDEWHECTIETAIISPQDIFETLLATQVLMHVGYKVNLDVRYLMGARMDRPINAFQPNTLALVTNLLNIGFKRIRVLDAHSSVATDTLFRGENVLPYKTVWRVMESINDLLVIIPDKGAKRRVMEYVGPLFDVEWRQAEKVRDPNTGALSGFAVEDASFVSGKNCLIIDDICDGGGTFTGLANVLREHGAKSVDLYVTHGIFSKGPILEGINTTYTTDSYRPKDHFDTYFTDKRERDRLIVFPISMKDLP